MSYAASSAIQENDATFPGDPPRRDYSGHRQPCRLGGARPGNHIQPGRAEKPGAFRFAAVDEASLGLWEGDRPILVYNHGARSKQGNPAPKPHSCYIHPLYGLDGEVLTDDFPADHLHHRGVFWAWPHVTVDGRHHDLWMQNGIEPRFERWGLRRTEKKQALLGVENGWYVAGRKVVSEHLLLLVHQAVDNGRAIDLDLTWTPVEKPVTLGGAEGRATAASRSGSLQGPTRRSRSHPAGPRMTCT